MTDLLKVIHDENRVGRMADTLVRGVVVKVVDFKTLVLTAVGSNPPLGTFDSFI
jgi:hypothetical protein